MDEDNEEPKIAQGFDRNIEYEPMKKKLIKEYKETYTKFLDENVVRVKTERNIRKLIYLLISMIQLRNGSRISEACEAFNKFFNFDKNEPLDTKVHVKVAKSKSIKYKKETKEKYITKERYRKIAFPTNWIDILSVKNIFDTIKDIDLTKFITEKRLKKRVLDYLSRNLNCNTHSLRYSFINYMLYDKKKEMSLVAKFVGHVDLAQLVRYTQNKNVDKLFDDDI